MNMRHTFLACALASTLAATAHAQEYKLTDIGTLGGVGQTFPGDLNAAGQVTGASINANRQTHSFIYQDGGIQDLGTLGSASYGLGINSLGHIVGYTDYDFGTHFGAFLYRGGVTTDIGSLGGSYATAAAINDSDQVVGQSSNSAGTRRAFLYGNGVMQDLGSLAGNGLFSSSAAAAINNKGEITGTSVIANVDPSTVPIGQVPPIHAFLSNNGTMTDLGTLGGEDSTGAGINDAGKIVGGAEIADGTEHAFLYSNGKMHDLGASLPTAYSVAEDINSSDDVVGSVTTNGTSGDAHAALFRGDRIIDLNSAVDRSSPQAMYVLLMQGVAINDAGAILVDGFDTQTDEAHAYLLTPVPLPSSLGLLLVSLVCFAWITRRRMS
jgi:probable HAF family extracellular repeat protein